MVFFSAREKLICTVAINMSIIIIQNIKTTMGYYVKCSGIPKSTNNNKYICIRKHSSHVGEKEIDIYQSHDRVTLIVICDIRNRGSLDSFGCAR